MTYINFDDYTMPQLSQIMDFMLKERGYTMTSEAREHAVKILNEEKDRASKDFGNGRTVRNLVEKAEKELALRLEGENKLTKNHGLPEGEIKKALTTITLADIQALSLNGIGSTRKARISFGEASARNDNTPPPASLEAVPTINNHDIRKSFRKLPIRL
jgi:hypothetical protein